MSVLPIRPRSMRTLARVESWYRSMCDGDWAHTYGITVGTLDSPGWRVDVEVKDTPLYGVPFIPIQRDDSDTNWIFCEVANGIFRGRCGIGQLDEVLTTFLDWAELHREA